MAKRYFGARDDDVDNIPQPNEAKNGGGSPTRGGEFSYFPHLQQLIQASQGNGGQGGKNGKEDEQPTAKMTQESSNNNEEQKVKTSRLTGRQKVIHDGPRMSKRKKRKLLKKTKKRARKLIRKNPFLKNKILPGSVKNKMDNPKVREHYKNFQNKQHDKSRIYQKMQQAKKLEQAQKIEKELRDEDKKQVEIGKSLKMSMLEEDLKRALEGPAGWAKNLKGCFSMSMICLTIIGSGVVGIILLAVL